MKKYLTKYILGLLTVLLALSSCYKQEVAPVIDPSVYPTATFAVLGNIASIVEGDTIKVAIGLNKPFDVNMPFDVIFNESSVSDVDDITVIGGTIPAYKLVDTMLIIFNGDELPELDEALSIEVGCHEVGVRYNLNSATVNKQIDLTLVNAFVPDFLTVAIGWDNLIEDSDDDWDTFIIDELGDAEWSGYAGATGANPEIMYLEADEAAVPSDSYYVELDPYAVDNTVVHFNVSICQPTGHVEFLTFTVKSANASTYAPGYIGFRAVKIVKSGTTFTCSVMPEIL